MVDFVEGSILPPPPPERVRLLEENFEQRFPPAYRDFLQRANGAKLVRPALRQGDGDMVIERFLPIVADPKTDPQGWADVAVVVTQLDERLVEDGDKLGYPIVPIAALFAGDFLVLDYRADAARPTVARWDHEASDELSPVTEPIADSFDDLLKRLDGPDAFTP